MQNENMNDTRLLVARLMRICVTYVCIVEAIMFVVNYLRDGIVGSPIRYLLLYVLLPVIWNILMCFFLTMVNRANKLNDEQKTMLVIFITTKICACVAIVHSYYIPTQCVFTISIVVAALIADRKGIIFSIVDSILMLAVVMVMTPIFAPSQGTAMMIESMVITVVVLVAVGTIGLAISQYVNQNNHLMRRYMKKLEKAVHESKLDVMTGLYHHTEFYNIMQVLTAGEEKKLSVVIMDIDHFKSVNDAYGHESGDEVIIAIADIIRRRNNDDTVFVSRYGGEEFAFIFVNCEREKVISEVQSVRREIGDLRYDFDRNRSVTMSAGLFECSTGSYSTRDIFGKADEALYYAKEHGRDQLCVYDEMKRMETVKMN